MTKKLAVSMGVLMLATSPLFVVPAQAGGVKVGVLTCAVEPGWGKIIASNKELNCNYVPNGGQGEPYFGSITKVGVDIGYTSGGTMIWNVVAPASDLGPGALEGKYAGATAQATVGIGLGANVLLGGFDKSIALQPVSIEGSTGLNIAAGIGAINLRHG